MKITPDIEVIKNVMKAATWQPPSIILFVLYAIVAYNIEHADKGLIGDFAFCVGMYLFFCIVIEGFFWNTIYEEIHRSYFAYIVMAIIIYPVTFASWLCYTVLPGSDWSSLIQRYANKHRKE